MGLQQVVDVLRQPRAAGPVFAHPLPEREQEIGAVLVLKQQVDFVNIYDDLAIRRGLRMVYHHREIDRDLFEKYRRRFCPYCSVASLYLWAVSGGAIPEMKITSKKANRSVQYGLYDRIRVPARPHHAGLRRGGDHRSVVQWTAVFRQYSAGADRKKEHPLFADAKRWLDVYFSGREPDFLPPLRYDSTPFRRLICEIMLTIPYGKTMTYGQIAAEAAKRLGAEKMSAQAVGGAVGHNPISLMIPCHRVVGTSGSLTGYGGGIARKVKLLELEHADMRGLFVPKTGTAL